MSYDLILEGGRQANLKDALTASAACVGCQIMVAPGAVTVALPRGEDAVLAAYARIVALARELGCRVHDPQSGSDIDLQRPGRLPPAY